uniref:Uncharacterized protein n=1 Tax=Lepeophtheirus salmonis TaxID=72036 RepID=A0A0K2V3E5_LEPSM
MLLYDYCIWLSLLFNLRTNKSSISNVISKVIPISAGSVLYIGRSILHSYNSCDFFFFFFLFYIHITAATFFFFFFNK